MLEDNAWGSRWSLDKGPPKAGLSGFLVFWEHLGTRAFQKVFLGAIVKVGSMLSFLYFLLSVYMRWSVGRWSVGTWAAKMNEHRGHVGPTIRKKREISCRKMNEPILSQNSQSFGIGKAPSQGFLSWRLRSTRGTTDKDAFPSVPTEVSMFVKAWLTKKRNLETKDLPWKILDPRVLTN
jgi:hypothetical protein